MQAQVKTMTGLEKINIIRKMESDFKITDTNLGFLSTSHVNRSAVLFSPCAMKRVFAPNTSVFQLSNQVLVQKKS